MKLFVLDTNVYVYYLQNNLSTLSSIVNKLFNLFDEGQCIFYVPTICFWEINRKIITDRITFGKLNSHEAIQLANKTIDNTPNFRDLPLTRRAASLAPTFSNILQDPFDQLIVASALDANLPLITKDINIQKSGLVKTVW